MLYQVPEITFEVQRKMNNEKITREMNFPTYKTSFFLWTPTTFKPYNFLISYSF
jgi:hypothetical protein